MSLEPHVAGSSSPPALGTGEPSSPMTPVKPRASRWRRYSLRALLLFQVVIAVFVGVVLLRVRTIQNQHEAAREIYEQKQFSEPFKTRPVWPAWFWEPVCHFCGATPATDIVEINSNYHLLKESEVSRLPYLETLSVTQGIEKSNVMAILAGSKDLKKLHFASNWEKNLNDDALIQLSKNQSLESLFIGGQYVTDIGIAALAEIPTLTSLHTWDTTITFKSLEPWVEKNRVQRLTIPFSPTSEEMRRLSHLSSLEFLHIKDIDEDTAAELKNFPKLNHVYIDVISTMTHRRIANSLPEQIELYNSRGKKLRVPFPTSTPP
jgi:hypothetical protein